MSAAFQSQVKNISEQAFKATFQGEKDDNQLATKFSMTFSQKLTLATKTYFSQCIGLPIGGAIVPAPPAQFATDIMNAGKDALTDTFQGEKDDNQLAMLFGQGLMTIASAVASWIPTNLTLPAIPPTMPLSPGGAVIAMPSASVVPACLTAAQTAYRNTFQGQTSAPPLEMIFATTFQQIGAEFGNMMSRVMSLPGGGALIVS
jgi:hypothetical protein